MRKTMIFALAVVLALPVAAMAQRPGGMGGDYGERGHGRKGGMMSQLDLSADQLAKMRELGTGTRKEMIELKSRMEIKRIDFQAELQKDNPDMAKINALIDEIVDARSQMFRKQLETQAEMTKILTPEQRQKMMERMGGAMLGGHMGGHDKKGRNR